MKMDMLRFVGAKNVDLPLLGANSSGPFVLKGAEGLGPTEVTVKMARTVLEKAIYQGKSASLRQIVALVGVQPNWDVGQTAEELRTELYSLLTPRYGKMVRAEIISNGEVKGYAQGHISRMEPALFTKDPAVQITMECDYAYFLSPTVKIQEPVQRTVSGIRAFDVENDGTALSGFRMGVILRSNVGTTLTLSDEDPQGQKIVIRGINWVSGDKFLVDTRPGTRGIWRGAGGTIYQSILNYLDAGESDWFGLYSGDNTLLLNTASFDWDPTHKFQHQPAYVGV